MDSPISEFSEMVRLPPQIIKILPLIRLELLIDISPVATI